MKLSLPGYKERVFFLGSNGSGKTVLASNMLSYYPRFVAFDVKGDLEIPNSKALVIKTPDDWHWQFYPNKYKRIIYRPKPEYASGPWLDYVLRKLYYLAQKRAKQSTSWFVVYLDEALFMAKTGSTKWMSALAVSGRSLNVGLWITSQRPTWIPVEVRSEAWRSYVFYLKRKQDQKEIVDDSNGKVTYDILNELGVDHSFLEIKRGKGGRTEVTHYPPLRLQEESTT